MVHVDTKSRFLNGVAAVLKRLGSVRKRNSWYFRSPETTCVINLQKSQWSDLYYLNFAVFFQSMRHKPDFLPEYKAPLRFRVDSILDRKMELRGFFDGDVTIDTAILQSALNLESETEEGDRMEVIRIAMEDVLLPIVKSCSTIQGVIELCNRHVLQRGYFWGNGMKILESLNVPTPEK